MSEDDPRTEEERAIDHSLKDSFPASDPPSAGGGSATPGNVDRQPQLEESDQEVDGDDGGE